MKTCAAMAACCMTLAALAVSAASAQNLITEQEWSSYSQRFLDETGRIIDDGNGNISHSEGQGYGLLLAYLAGSKSDFARIWSFTKSELLLRSDGLAAWKWSPDATPHVTDVNNAADGDLLIAYALARAGEGWEDPELTGQAARIAKALSQSSVYQFRGRYLLRPGVTGFDEDEQPDGPVVNPSYWVFESFPILDRLNPEGNWSRLSASGQQLVRETSLGAADLPPEWVSLQSRPQPAAGFPAEFSYNALRIPLYLIRAGVDDRDLIGRLGTAMTGKTGGVMLVDLRRNVPTDELMDPGYRIIPALAACIAADTTVPAELLHFEPTLYYPSTLHLLALSHIREARPQCT